MGKAEALQITEQVINPLADNRCLFGDVEKNREPTAAHVSLIGQAVEAARIRHHIFLRWRKLSRGRNDRSEG